MKPCSLQSFHLSFHGNLEAEDEFRLIRNVFRFSINLQQKKDNEQTVFSLYLKCEILYFCLFVRNVIRFELFFLDVKYVI